MKPMQLSLSAWGSYPGEVHVDFTTFEEQGIFLITGPTGAGKTTIFDAISFALYGNVSGSVREKTSLRSDFAKPEAATYVELTFKHKGRHYKIRRIPKYERQKKRQSGTTTQSETAELYFLDEEDRQPITKVSDVNEAIYELMGIDYNQFKQIAMIAQGEFQKLLIADSEERVKILRKLFRTDHFERIGKLLTEQALSLGKARATEKTKIDSNLLNLRVHSEELQEKIVAEDKDYEAILVSVKLEVKEEEKEVREKSKIRKQAETEKEKLNATIQEAKDQLEKRKQLQQCQVKLDQLSMRKAEIEEKEHKIERIREAKEVMPYYSRFHTMKEEEDKAKNRLEFTIEQLKKVEVELKAGEENVKQAEILQEQNEKLNSEKAYLEPFSEMFEKQTKLKKELAQADTAYQRAGSMNEQMKDYLKESKEKEEGITKQLERYEGAEQSLAEKTVELEKKKQQIKLYEEEKERQNRIGTEKDKYINWSGQRDVQKEKCTMMKDRINEETIKLTRAQAGILASKLEEGKPCPVCGSKEHPAPEKLQGDVLSEEQIKGLEEEYTKEFDKLANMESYVVRQKTLVETLDTQSDEFLKQFGIQKNEFTDAYVACSKDVVSLEQSLKDENAKLRQKKLLEEQAKALKEQIAKCESDKIEKDQQLELLRTSVDGLKGKLGAIEETLPKEFATEELLVRRLQEIVATIAQNSLKANELKQKQEMLAKQKQEMEGSQKEIQVTIQNLANQLQFLKQEFEQALLSHKFENETVFQEMINQASDLPLIEQDVSMYKDETIRVHQLKEGLEKEIKEDEPISLEELENKKVELLEVLTEMEQWIQERATNIDINKDIIAKVEKNLSQLGSVNEKYRIYTDLDNAAKGFNSDRMKLEQFVLSVYFKEILKAANARLSTMTGGRYELLKADKVEDARKRGSLELEVMDYYTGKRRSVKTLSGGESFKAAICLALGLSDIVQNNAGGIEIETLFIDEGFGALDSESLEQALETLGSLSANNRLIGIISHVSELKERIDHQIIVSRTQQGSRVEIQ
ncbi:exonuclease SbcC [Lachnospiraceae bacterium KM106-2]|nr:exonuclease SbcC [Lachnospiraceae bacterium KM106-2]